ncbi:MAG: hypothetical protein OQK75_04835 [Gammaproteobacteria bacterium]|nr:hypothetical protein [Gammaproteobacteria bacterium]MCW8986979.1 hypothetical protein [Gammaproteobacteria bacterium]MCW9031909.1 hypothetical protein [Gammaproteobacteria bacterium]
MKYSSILRTTGCYLICVSSSIYVNPLAAEALHWAGDFRTGYFSQEREARSGVNSSRDEGRVRLRFGGQYKANDSWQFKLRAAGRSYLEKNNPNSEIKIFSEIPAGDGLRAGDVTLDEIYAQYKKEKMDLKFGRFQTKMELEGVAKKSLDRNDSPNTDITWTDGIYTKIKLEDWLHHFILQYNYPTGATEVRRSPLDFSSSESRLSAFWALENRKKTGAFVQRGIDITYLPSALCEDGTTSCNTRKDYITIVGRLAMQWPISSSGTKFMLGTEAGYAVNTQLSSVARTGASGNADGVAWQLTFNFIDIAPKHSMGLVYANAGAGWLISPDFRNNNSLVELRYKWAIDKRNSLEARIRQRQDLQTLVGETRKQIDDDLYVRYTWKF